MFGLYALILYVPVLRDFYGLTVPSLPGLFVIGLGVKTALVPLHGWLPRAMVAPAPVSALLHAVAVVKAGAFGIVRVVYDVYGIRVANQLGVLRPLAIIASGTILYGSLRALQQDDLKRRLAYSTVSQVSYIVLGVATFGPIATIGGISFGAGVLFFPISYIFGDVLTEVYGYARARKVVWAGFGALVFASFMATVVVALPPAPGWPHQEAYATVFGSTWRIVAASLLAFWVGEFCNSYVLARMKVWSSGRHLWQRTIGSTIVGEGVDSLVFYHVAFLGVWKYEQVFQVLVTNYFIKCAWEAVATPVTYRVVGWLKRAEHEDYYDRDTDFNPFALREQK